MVDLSQQPGWVVDYVGTITEVLFVNLRNTGTLQMTLRLGAPAQRSGTPYISFFILFSSRA